MADWKKIWNKRKCSKLSVNLGALIRADGFDTGAGNFDAKSWLKYVDYIAKKTSLKSTESVFEVGCGSGAFLYPLYSRSHKVGGIDYSISLIKTAKRAMPGMEFENIEACNMYAKPNYDIVVSNSVFQYFDTLEYAELVIKKMIDKANTKIVILDINDKLKESEALSIRKGLLNNKEYNEKYSELRHMFYGKDWFNDIAIKNDCNIEIFDQDIDSYLNSKYRFNVVLSKKSKTQKLEDFGVEV